MKKTRVVIAIFISIIIAFLISLGTDISMKKESMKISDNTTYTHINFLIESVERLDY